MFVCVREQPMIERVRVTQKDRKLRANSANHRREAKEDYQNWNTTAAGKHLVTYPVV
jgi:hypothetical protein